MRVITARTDHPNSTDTPLLRPLPKPRNSLRHSAFCIQKSAFKVLVACVSIMRRLRAGCVLVYGRLCVGCVFILCRFCVGFKRPGATPRSSQPCTKQAFVKIGTPQIDTQHDFAQMRAQKRRRYYPINPCLNAPLLLRTKTTNADECSHCSPSRKSRAVDVLLDRGDKTMKYWKEIRRVSATKSRQQTRKILPCGFCPSLPTGKN